MVWRRVGDVVGGALQGAGEAARRVADVLPRRDDGTPVSHVDDDPDAVELEPLELDVHDEERLRELDAEADLGRPPSRDDPEAIHVPEDSSFFDLLRERVDPGPGVPVGQRHEAQLVGLVRNLAIASGDPGLADSADTNRIARFLGDRLSLVVDPTGVTVVGLVRRRSVAWTDLQRVRVTSRYEALRDRMTAGATSQALARAVPIPGLRWLVGKVTGAMVEWLEGLASRHVDVDGLREESGLVVTDLERRGLDIELDGLLGIVAVLAAGTCDAIVAEARLRGIEVVE